jgi:hypothetical protein
MDKEDTEKLLRKLSPVVIPDDPQNPYAWAEAIEAYENMLIAKAAADVREDLGLVTTHPYHTKG